MTDQDNIELYFKQSAIASFSPPERDNPTSGQPLLFLRFHDLQSFNKPNIHKTISEYFNKDSWKLIIFMDDDLPIKLSIVNKITGDAVNIENVLFTEMIYDFINQKDENEEITLLTAYISSKEILYAEDAVKNNVVRIDGYSLAYM